jgi:hypothetical protein
MEDQKKSSGEKVSDEDRYKYIGFEIYPGETRKFWENEEEKKNYIEEIQRKKSSSSLLEREHSLIKMTLFSKTDKVVLTIASIFMALCLFLPWFSVKGTGLLFFFQIGKLPAGGVLFGLFMVLMILTILSSAAAGVINLGALYKKEKDPESYLANLKKKLKLNYLPLILWAVVLFISVIGMNSTSPGSSAGGSFNIINLFTQSSVGLWLSLPSLIINCVKISDL